MCGEEEGRKAKAWVLRFRKWKEQCSIELRRKQEERVA
jgi:hypothetical protein